MIENPRGEQKIDPKEQNGDEPRKGTREEKTQARRYHSDSASENQPYTAIW